MKQNVTIYQISQLPEVLQPIATMNNKSYVTLDEVERSLNETAINLYAIETMLQPHTTTTAIQGYRLGSAKGFSSLTAICSEYLSERDKRINAKYIKLMHAAAKPFVPQILKNSIDTKVQAQELLDALEFCKNHFKAEITEL